MCPIYNNFQFEQGADPELANIMEKFDCIECGDRRNPENVCG